MYSCSFLTISGTIASGSCFFAIRRNVCSSQRYSIISSTVALSLCTLFAVYCALLRYHTALSVLPTQAHRLAVHAGIHHPLFVLLICIETFLTPNTVQLMMYTTLNAPVCLSLSLYPQSSTLAYSQAIESRADLTGNGETRETGKKAR